MAWNYLFLANSLANRVTTFLKWTILCHSRCLRKVVWPFSSTVILEKETAPSVVSITATGGSALLADLLSSWNCTAYCNVISWKAGDCLYPAAAFLKQRAFCFTPFNTGYLEEHEYILGLGLETSGDLDDWHGRRKSYRR
jgi:hypothetical protein